MTTFVIPNQNEATMKTFRTKTDAKNEAFRIISHWGLEFSNEGLIVNTAPSDDVEAMVNSLKESFSNVKVRGTKHKRICIGLERIVNSDGHPRIQA